MKWRRIDPFSTPDDFLFEDGHLSDAAFLHFLDGELSPNNQERVDAHVHSCWTCRARLDTTSRGISDFAYFQNGLVRPQLPPPPQGKAVFVARLDELAAELGCPTPIYSWPRFKELLMEWGSPSRPAWIAGVLLVLMALPLFYWLQHRPATITPDDLLRRAQVAEETEVRGIDRPVLIQKVRIEADGHVVGRTVYRDLVRKRHKGKTDAGTDSERTIQVSAAQYIRDWDAPLSVGDYTAWRQNSMVNETVAATGKGDLWQLRSVSSKGQVAEVSLTIRASDYHLTEESILLRDDTRIEVAELSFEAVPFVAISADIFANPMHLSTTKTPSLPREGIESVPDLYQLATAEMDVRSRLHALDADLGEQIVVKEEGAKIVVEGIVSDDHRKHTLVASLRGIPYTQLAIQTASEEQARYQSSAPSSNLNFSSITVSSPQTPLLNDVLRNRYPKDEERAAYINQVLSLSQSASARAWALNRLAERYSPERIRLLSDVSQQQLRGLLQDHLEALHHDIYQLQSQLGVVIALPREITTDKSALSPSSPPGTFTDSPGDWRSRIHRAHSSVETLNESITVLLAGSSPAVQESPEEVEAGLRSTLTQLLSELQTLDQKTHRLF